MLCSTSAYEGFGVPYVEALASGLPVVTTPNDGASEVLRNGELGLICSPAELPDAICALIHDDARRQRMAAAGLRAADSYSVDVVAARYESWYRDVGARAAN